jgi:hypothetical protein
MTWRTLVLPLWAVLICCVVIGSLLPAASPVMVQKEHREAGYDSSTPILGILMEAGQHFSPGRAVELGDVLANGAGVSCGALLGLPFRTLIAIL